MIFFFNFKGQLFFYGLSLNVPSDKVFIYFSLNNNNNKKKAPYIEHRLFYVTRKH